VGWGGELTKGKTCGLRYRQFNKTAKQNANITTTTTEYENQTIVNTIFFSLPDGQLCS